MTTTDFNRILDRLIASTRSPRGRYSAQNTWPLLRRRLHASYLRRRRRTLWLRTAGAAACLAIVLLGGWMAWQTWGGGALHTVATLAETARENHVTKTALITVGGFLGSSYDRSLLYDPGFSHGCREAGR